MFGKIWRKLFPIVIFGLLTYPGQASGPPNTHTPTLEASRNLGRDVWLGEASRNPQASPPWKRLATLGACSEGNQPSTAPNPGGMHLGSRIRCTELDSDSTIQCSCKYSRKNRRGFGGHAYMYTHTPICMEAQFCKLGICCRTSITPWVCQEASANEVGGPRPNHRAAEVKRHTAWKVRDDNPSEQIPPTQISKHELLNHKFSKHSYDKNFLKISLVKLNKNSYAYHHPPETQTPTPTTEKERREHTPPRGDAGHPRSITDQRQPKHRGQPEESSPNNKRGHRNIDTYKCRAFLRNARRRIMRQNHRAEKSNYKPPPKPFGQGMARGNTTVTGTARHTKFTEENNNTE